MACECGQCPTDICHGWGNIEEMEMSTERDKFDALQPGDHYEFNGKVTVMPRDYYHRVLGNKE
jgi:hypothetical protein